MAVVVPVGQAGSETVAGTLWFQTQPPRTADGMSVDDDSFQKSRNSPLLFTRRQAQARVAGVDAFKKGTATADRINRHDSKIRVSAPERV